MSYTPLSAFLAKDSKKAKNYKEEFKRRFKASTTTRFDIAITPNQGKKSFQAFLCYPIDLMLSVQNLYKSYSSLLLLLNQLSPIIVRQFVLALFIREIKATNELDGNILTQKQLCDLIDNPSKSDKKSSFYNIIENYKKIIQNNYKLITKLQDLSSFNPDFSISEEQSVTIEYLLHILNDDKMPLLIRISLFHYLFSYIHPLNEGNELTVRLITSHYLAQEFGPLVALKLSTIINKRKKAYSTLFDEMNSEYNSGDLTPFVIGHISFVQAALDEVIQQLSRKRKQFDTFNTKLNSLSSNDALSQDIYSLLLQSSTGYGEGLTIKQLMDYTEKTRVTIQTRLDSIPGEHLQIDTSHKPYRYKLNFMMFKHLSPQ